MEANRKRNIRSGEDYSHLFPKAEGSTSTIRKNADVTHTVAFIPKVVNKTLHHTKQLAQRLKGNNTYETCSNIWHFVYQHIAYKKDEDGFEQIRSPSRAWHDRKQGVDCDCYTVFISSILTNCKIPHVLRITKYNRDYFQHIYPVVPFNGKYITLDCVTDEFDYEVPYSEKKDYPMDLQYLNGFDGNQTGDLGALFGKKKAKANSLVRGQALPKKKISLFARLKDRKAPKAADPNNGSANAKKKGFFKKALNTVNKVNPATVLLRNGILAAMRLNVKNVARRLRWSYLSPGQAAQEGIDAAKFQRLVATRQKLEKIFYGAGGTDSNLRKAILGGKGNGDKAVAGLDGFSTKELDYINAYTPLPQVLGPEIYYSENVEGFSGHGQLGEPVTLASIGAAMGVLAGIVAALKQIGDIFPKKTKGSEDFDEKLNEAAENNVPVPGTTPVPLPEASAPLPITAKLATEESFTNTAPSSNASMPVGSETYSTSTSPYVPAIVNNAVVTAEEGEKLPILRNESAPSDTPPPAQETFWDRNRAWLKPVAIGVGGISLIAIGFAVLQSKGQSRKQASSLSGLPGKRRKAHQRKHKTYKSKSPKKTAIALL